MNTLPTELEDIIYNYTHQLKMDDVLNELARRFGVSGLDEKASR